MAVKYSARQIRALITRIQKKHAVREDADHMLTTAAVSNRGACIVIRPSDKTKVVCRETTRSVCTEINTQLSIEGAGSATFYPGDKCQS